MGHALDALPGTVFLLGDTIRTCMDRARESDDVKKIRELLEEAAGALDHLTAQAKAADAELEESR